MQKVYLLLRNNQQTGPFNLEELIRFDLKPYDLIWIEGKSSGWYYPQEIKALHPYLPFVKQAPAQPVTGSLEQQAKKTFQPAQPKKIFVAMPATIQEEPTPKPSFITSSFKDEEPVFSEPIISKEKIKTSYSRPVEEVETDYMNWMYQNKTKKKSFVSMKGSIAACLIVSLAFAGWWMMRPSEEATKNIAEEQAAFVTAQNELPADSITENDVPVQNNDVVLTAKKQQKNKQAIIEKKTVFVEKKEAPKKKIEGAMVNISTSETNEYESAPPLIKEEDKPAIIEKKAEVVITDASKEKKKLRDKIADIFKKKSKQEKTEDAKPVEEENGQRNSTRRETGANLAKMVSVKFEIPNDWMMGIKGAKATLTNRSSEAIAKAVVEVVYYNEDNDVIDKKTISVNDIKSKQSKTIAIPDHATATRLEYNVVLATGVGEPFAKM